jgi:hypothetical protein
MYWINVNIIPVRPQKCFFRRKQSSDFSIVLNIRVRGRDTGNGIFRNAIFVIPQRWYQDDADRIGENVKDCSGQGTGVPH